MKKKIVTMLLAMCLAVGTLNVPVHAQAIETPNVMNIEEVSEPVDSEEMEELSETADAEGMEELSETTDAEELEETAGESEATDKAEITETAEKATESALYENDFVLDVEAQAPEILQAGDVAINTTNFPDAVFRNYVSENCDTDNNGILSAQEAQAVEKIAFSMSELTSLQGIAYFTELVSLDCFMTQLTDVDISHNKKLEKLFIYGSKLEKLDVSQNVAIKELQVTMSRLKELDVSKNTALESLEITICSDFGEGGLDVSHNPNLMVLSVEPGRLTEIDVSENPQLKSLNVSGNPISQLDLSANPKLEKLHCDTTQIKSLNLRHLTELQELDCSNCPLKYLNISNNHKIRRVDCHLTDIEYLNISQCAKLIEVYELNDTKTSNGTTTYKMGNNIYNSLEIDTGLKIITQGITPYLDDVDGAQWYARAIAYVVDRGIMGVSEDQMFHPTNPLTRAMFVTMLYSLEGRPSVSYSEIFTDVPRDAWYTDAVMWAREKRIATGTGDGTVFSPDGKINREQLATILYAYAKYKDCDLTVKSQVLDPFTDQGKVSSWAKEPMKWAVTNGLLGGKGDGDDFRLDPAGVATRAEAAQAMMNFAVKFDDRPYFDDVDRAAWYAEAVEFVATRGIMNGVGNRLFKPMDTMNRAMFVTMLYNKENKPSIAYTNTFTDIPDGTWYTSSVLWAKMNGITEGVGDGTRFAPDQIITREQLAKMFYFYAKAKKYDLSFNNDALDTFSDKGKVSSWAKEPMKWAVTHGVLNGKGTEKGVILDPAGKASRAEAAKMMMNFMKQFEGK